jgi:hypothetical protein
MENIHPFSHQVATLTQQSVGIHVAPLVRIIKINVISLKMGEIFVKKAVYNRTNPNVALTIPAPRGMQEYHRL